MQNQRSLTKKHENTVVALHVAVLIPTVQSLHFILSQLVLLFYKYLAHKNVLVSWIYILNTYQIWICGTSQWPRGIRRSSTEVRLLSSNPTGDMDVCLLWVLSGRGLCDELAPRPGKPYRLWCVVVCNFETSWVRSQNKAGWTDGRRLQQIDNVAI